MKVILACVLVGVVGLVKGESDYYLRGPKPTTLIHYGFKPISTPSGAPTQLFESHHVRPMKSKIESYIFGDNPPPPPPLPPPTKHVFHHQKVTEIPRLNALPRDPKDPFEVVAAPVIYHRTVTDTDVTKALAAAFEAVDLKKPRYKTSEESVTTTVEFVNHPYSLDSPKASLMTTVVNPQQMTVMQPLSHPGGFTYVPGTVAIAGMFPPVPSAADLPPPPQPQIVQVQAAPVAISTAPPAVEAPVQVAPATSTSTVPATVLSQAPPPATAPPPKIIIPNQPHVTTLENINRGSVLIQPIFIPYAVDQNGQPVGALPDYQAMDFGAIISAQKQLLSSPSPVAPQPGFIQQIMNSYPMQFHREVQPFQTQAQQEPQFYYIPNQNIASVATPPADAESVTNEDGTSSRSSIIRTRTGKRFKSTAQ